MYKLFSLIILLLCGSNLLDANTNEFSIDTKAIVEKLELLDRVEGSAVYYSAKEGDFYAFSLELLKMGTKEEFVLMTNHQNIIVRMMGIYCLVKTQKKLSFNIIRKFFSSRKFFTCFPSGCMGGFMTEGQFARHLIHNYYFLEEYTVKKHLLEDMGFPVDENSPKNNSLLSQNELIVLDIEILASDSCYGLHRESSYFLAQVIKKRDIELEINYLKKLCPLLKNYQIIKAIGRISVGLNYPKPDENNIKRNFLIQCLEDSALDFTSRLAAASALTMHSDIVSILTLQQNQEFLNSLSENSLGDLLEKTIQSRLKYQKILEKILESQEMETLLELYSFSHPMVLNQFNYIHHRSNSEELGKTVENTLIHISQNLSEYTQDWNVYSYAPYQLHIIISLDSTLKKFGVSESNEKDILRNIDKFISKE